MLARPLASLTRAAAAAPSRASLAAPLLSRCSPLFASALPRPSYALVRRTTHSNAHAMLDSAPRLAALRQQLAHHDLAAYIVDSGDSHANEYLAHADERRAWISGFTGSAGTALVLQQQALLWTDGRYHQQAAQQLSPDWTLMKHGAPSVPSWTEWLSDPAHSSSAFPRGSRIGLDPALVTVADYTSLAPALAAAGVELVPIRENLVDVAWDADERAQSGGAHGKPQRPREEVFVLDDKYAGESAQSKIERVRRELDKRDVFGDDPKAKPGTGDKRCWGLVVTLLDEIAWLLNLRGSDIPFNPVFFAYLVLPTVSSSRPTLFIDLEQVPQKTYDYLNALDILIEPYEHYVDFLEGVGKVLGDEDLVLLPSRTSLSSALALSLARCVTSQRGPIALLKALKNPTEVQGFRDCHVRDGVALVRYFAWLERELKQGKELREYEAALQLEEFRKQLEHFRGLSFSTISSTGANASVIHYSPAPDGQSAVIDPTKIYLCDSGAQFTDGTTDVTRTLHFGTPTSFERRAYTRVLQGHLAIDRAVFPSTTTGYMLDPFARVALWQDGLDYRHGTGHGVGHFLNVHEGPMGIGTRVAYNDVKLQPYQILSNEPGYYHEAPAEQGGRDASFGIRIENLVCVVPAQTEHAFGGVKYYRMERLTMCPIAINLVDPALLELRELEWLNKYNAECLAKVGPLLRETGDADAVEWLERSCRPLSVV